MLVRWSPKQYHNVCSYKKTRNALHKAYRRHGTICSSTVSTGLAKLTMQRTMSYARAMINVCSYKRTENTPANSPNLVHLRECTPTTFPSRARQLHSRCHRLRRDPKRSLRDNKSTAYANMENTERFTSTDVQWSYSRYLAGSRGR